MYICRQHGFTLVELSIVLVIIGLLVGGVLVGRDLIHAAEVRMTAGQIEKLDAAVNAFKLKYNCLPGDCANADSFGFVEVPSNFGTFPPNGNGNGVIYNNESFVAISILQQAGLIGGVGQDGDGGFPIILPKVPSVGSDGYLGGWWVEHMYVVNTGSIQQPEHYYWATTFNGITSGLGLSVGNIGIFSANDAYAIDSKIDNGLPRSGKVLAGGSGLNWDGLTMIPKFIAGTDDLGAAGSGNTHCVASGTPDTYNVLNNSPSLCSITVKASF